MKKYFLKIFLLKLLTKYSISIKSQEVLFHTRILARIYLAALESAVSTVALLTFI